MKKHKKIFMSSLMLTFLLLFSFNANVFAAEKITTEKRDPSKVIHEITIQDLQKEKVLKTETFTENKVEYTRHYTTESDYYVTCVENAKTQYYVNLLNIYPLVKYSETANNAKGFGKNKDKKFVKMYYDGYGHFMLTFDLLDEQSTKFWVEDKEYTGVKYSHFMKIEK